MPCIRKGGWPLAALLVVCLAPTAAFSQDVPRPLHAPTLAASIASAADWATTYHALKHYHLREANPLLRPLERTPGKMVAMGVAIDVASFSAWNLTLGRDHPKIAAAGLWGVAAFRGYLAWHNLRNTRRAERRHTSPPTPAAPLDPAVRRAPSVSPVVSDHTLLPRDR